jgi:1-deoxy-D-xylulose-5-phosphate reductoisomerase
MKKLLVLGATGSIGTQTVDLVRVNPDRFELCGVSAYSNKSKLMAILDEFKSIRDVWFKAHDQELIDKYPGIRFHFGPSGMEDIVNDTEYDLLVNVISGFSGFIPTYLALKRKKKVALANKESLVIGGDQINRLLKENGDTLIPIDSEHSAISMCLRGFDKDDVRKLIITASGGSFRDLSREQLRDVTVKDALKHPTWSMGSKITIDSATMMNKGFEVIEAHYLFDMDYDKIDTVLHKESIIHSFVQYKDGSTLALMDNPDMHNPIALALADPKIIDRYDQSSFLDLSRIGEMHFAPLSTKRYPLLGLAYEVGRKGGNMGAALVGANDTAVGLFLEEKISFLDIERLVFECLKEVTYNATPEYQDLIDTYDWAASYINDHYQVSE